MFVNAGTVLPLTGPGAARSVDECLRLARSDLTVRTSLLERRLIAGDAGLLATLTWVVGVVAT